MNTESPNNLSDAAKPSGPALWWRAARDLALIAAFLILPVYAASWGQSCEHDVCARVLAIKDGRAQVEFWWQGRTYTTSIAADDTLKPAGAATVSLHFVGSPGTAIRGRGGHGPYTTLGTIAMMLPFFLMGLLVVAVGRRVWGRRIAPAAVQVIDLIIRRLGKEPSPKTRTLTCAAIAVVCMGTLNSCQQSRQPRNSPEQLGRAFLAAVHARNLNQAAYLVDYEDRYEFLGVAPSWVLVDYEILEATNDTIRYRYASVIDGRRVSGEAELPVVHNYGGYWIGRLLSPPG